MEDLHFTLHTIEYSKPQYIRKIIKEFDDKLWLVHLQKKITLILYREYKHVIHDEQDLYDNSAATTLFRGRTGTLKLNKERRHTDGYTNCSTSTAGTTEDIEHFVIDCAALTSTRQYIIALKDHTNKTEKHVQPSSYYLIIISIRI